MNSGDKPEIAEQPAKAVALFYDGLRAPVLTAKGVGADAEQIVRIAEESGVPLCDNAPLVDLLSQLELGDRIPEQVYLAVAHILAFAYQLQFADNAEDSN